MKIQVFRKACCSQDDQIGPLEATYVMSPDAVLKDLVDQIVASKFLQYSSSHTTMLGEVGPLQLVKVFSPYHAEGKPPEYLAPPDQRLRDLLLEEAVSFRFEFD